MGIFFKFLVLITVTIVTKSYGFDFMEMFGYQLSSDINVNKLKQEVIMELDNLRRYKQSHKMISIYEQEKMIKNKMSDNIKANIKKQIEIEEENKKFIKYYEIIKERNKKTNVESEEDEIIKFVENLKS